jgi:hypothetical protein
MSEQGKPNQPESEEPKYQVKKVCPWCNKEIGSAGYKSTDPNEVSHGICPECLKKMEDLIDKEDK